MESPPLDRKQALRDVFDRSAAGYERIRYFPIFGQWLVETAHIPDGASVLDVACGRGAVLFPAAERVGPAGNVIGIDLSESMAHETDREIRRRGLKRAEARQMDAEQLTFPDARFDVVLCGFSLQFFPNLAQALSEFRRVLKPGGILAATTWGADDERWQWFEDLRKAHGAVLKLGSQTLDTPAELRSRFSGAGFTDIQITTREVELVYVDAEEWWNVEWSISGRAGLERLSATELHRFQAEAMERLQAQKSADGFHYRLEALCTTAKAR